MTTRLPVLMLHAVAPAGAHAPHRWLERLTTSPELLEATFDAWRRSGVRTLGTEELRAFLAGERGVPDRSVVLTLDDGYLDNWVGLTPLLEAYGFRAIVFMSTDFIDPRPVVRPRQGDPGANGKLEWTGYLSWDEMRAAESRGLLEIQSHAKTHTWYFTSDRIVDYYRPDNALTESRSRLRFLWLNAHTERKPFALSEMRDAAIPWGTPVYEFAPALVARRFTPDPAETDDVVAFVSRSGGAAFFAREDWRSRLDAEVSRRRAGRGPGGAYESEEDKRARIRAELVESRDTLARGLGHAVDFLSFPQGGMEPSTESLAREAGYVLWTMPSKSGSRASTPADGPHRVFRCGSGYGLFGESAGIRAALLSHRLVMARHFGNPLAGLATRAVGLTRRLSRRVAGER